MKNQTRLLDADQLDVWSPPLPNFCGWAFSLDLNAGWFASGQTCISTHSTHSRIWILLKVSWSSRHLAYKTLGVIYKNNHFNPIPTHFIPTMSYKTNYELYVSKNPMLYLSQSIWLIFFSVSRKHRQQTVTPTARWASLTIGNALPACCGPAATI